MACLGFEIQDFVRADNSLFFFPNKAMMVVFSARFLIRVMTPKP